MSRWLCAGLLLAVCCSVPCTTVEAAEPAMLAAARTRILFVRKGDAEITNFGTLNDIVSTDRFIVVLIGTGVAKLTVADADAPGDTINATGSLQTVFPVTFNDSATSPAQILKNLPVTGFGILTVDVGFTNLVNPIPANYFYKLKF
jgi:hypothetical protein